MSQDSEDYHRYGKVDNKTHRQTQALKWTEEIHPFILCGLNTGFGLVNQSTTGTISAAAFQAALGVYVTQVEYTTTVRGNGRDKKLEGKALEKRTFTEEMTETNKEADLWSLSSRATGSP